MVRLKELISIIALLTAIIFQFLMVRLKDSSVFTTFNNLFISIPYGAIKRAKVPTKKAILLIFQFLMVRLKVG